MKDLKGFFRKKKVLVTGHTGFKGSWLTRALIDCGADVIGIALEPNTSPNLFDALNIKDKIKHYICDINDFELLSEIISKEQPEIVFHLAAQPLVRESYDDPLYTYRTNCIGTANILECIKHVNCVKSAVMITTDKVYENKESEVPYKEEDELGGYDPYSSSKVCAELVIKSYIRSFFNPKDFGKKHNTLVASARAGNAIGGGDWSKERLIPDIINGFFETGERVVIRNPKAIRPWQYVLEPLAGYLMLARGLYFGNKELVGAWNFAPNKPNFIEVEEVVKKAKEILGRGEYVIEEEHSKHETKILKLDAGKAKKVLKWRAVLDIDEALRWTFEWYKRFYDKEDMDLFTRKEIHQFFLRFENGRTK